MVEDRNKQTNHNLCPRKNKQTLNSYKASDIIGGKQGAWEPRGFLRARGRPVGRGGAELGDRAPGPAHQPRPARPRPRPGPAPGPGPAPARCARAGRAAWRRRRAPLSRVRRSPLLLPEESSDSEPEAEPGSRRSSSARCPRCRPDPPEGEPAAAAARACALNAAAAPVRPAAPAGAAAQAQPGPGLGSCRRCCPPRGALHVG